MQNTQGLRKIRDNQLIAKLIDHCDRHGLSLDDMAKELCFSEVFLKAMVRGERDIRDLSTDGYRQIAAVLGISCFSALLLAGCLTVDDLVDHRVLTVDDLHRF